MSTSQMIAAGYGMMIILMAGVAAAVYLGLSSVNGTIDEVIETRQPAAVASLELEKQVDRTFSALNAYLVIENPEFVEQRQVAWSGVEKHAATLGELLASEAQSDQKGKIDELTELLTDLRKTQDEIEFMALLPQNTPAKVFLEEEILPMSEEMLEALWKMIQLEREEAGSSERKELLWEMTHAHGTLSLAVGALSTYVEDGTDETLAAYTGHWEAHAELAAALSDHEDLMTEDQADAFGDYDMEAEEFPEVVEDVLRKRSGVGWNVSRFILTTAAQPKGQAVRDILEEIVETQLAAVQGMGEDLREESSSLRATVIGAGMLAIVLGCFVALRITRIVSRMTDRQAGMELMLDQAPASILRANNDLEITYFNESAKRNLEKVASALPIPVDEIIGSHVEDFHADASGKRELLSDPANLPLKSEIRLAEETFEIQVSAIYRANGSYAGPMVTWAAVTEARALQNKQARMQLIIEQAPVCILRADEDLVITYMNLATRDLLSKLEHVLHIPVDLLLNTPLTALHPHFQENCQSLRDPECLPQSSEIQLGDEVLEMTITAIHDTDGAYTGPMLTWKVVTASRDLEYRSRTTTEELLACAKELQISAGELIENSEVVAEASGETLLQSEEVSGVTNQVADSAAGLSETTSDIAVRTSELKTLMEELMEHSRVSSSSMESLRTANREITMAGDNIAKIADQTSMLALNATIEASRAGEAGGRFAIVAAEVKQLSRMTWKATESIGDQAAQVHERADDLAETVEKIDRVISAVNGLAKSLNTAAAHQEDMTGEISKSIGLVAGRAEEISGTMSGVTEKANRANESSRRVMDASNQLHGLASRLSSHDRA